MIIFQEFFSLNASTIPKLLLSYNQVSRRHMKVTIHFNLLLFFYYFLFVKEQT